MTTRSRSKAEREQATKRTLRAYYRKHLADMMNIAPVMSLPDFDVKDAPSLEEMRYRLAYEIFKRQK